MSEQNSSDDAAVEDDGATGTASAVSPFIDPDFNGPLVVTGVERLTNSRGETLPTSERMELCRCGGSATKPFCDGTHEKLGFKSQRQVTSEKDQAVAYPGTDMTVYFNERQCSGAGECARGLPSVFRDRDVIGKLLRKPWIQPDRADTSNVVEVINRCPSGALRYSIGGTVGPDHSDPPAIHIRRNGAYEVRGNIGLNTDFWPGGSARQIYALCRCGASRNKPFCDGSHYKAGFRDSKN